LQEIIARALSGQPLVREEIEFLLRLRSAQTVSVLFEAARELRSRYFGNRVFLYGFVYFSTWCRNRCHFCFYRRGNRINVRYRKTPAEILEVASALARSGVHLIDLTMGEDPFFFEHAAGFDLLADIVQAVKKETGLPVMVSTGVPPREALAELASAGADWYACYQETHNRELFARLRPGQSYDERLEMKYFARKLGLLVEEGILTGVGDTLADVVTSIGVMARLGAQQVRVMSFVPQKGTPMERWASPPRLRELVTIAVFRLVFPDRLIPASLDVDGIAGLEDRLKAGANVITSLIPPRVGLAGVSRSSLDIDEGYRTPEGVLPVLERLGLKPANLEDYTRWIQNNRVGAGNENSSRRW
jgi:methylornithine synthase